MIPAEALPAGPAHTPAPDAARNSVTRKTTWYRANFIARMIFLLLTPTIFRYLNFAFVWHSIYWGAVTMVVILWGSFILLSPLFGRVGCGWVCFMGTVQDFGGQHAFFERKPWRPTAKRRTLYVLGFLGSASVFFLINQKSGLISGWRFDPYWLSSVFNEHYKHIWLYDTLGALFVSLLMHKRWACRVCPMGSLCAAGANYSRLLPVVDASSCTSCGKCERECPIQVPILALTKQNRGLILDADCLLCGKCKAVCPKDAVELRFVWNRKKHLADSATSHGGPE